MSSNSIKLKSYFELMDEYDDIRQELLIKREELENRISKLKNILINNPNMCLTVRTAYEKRISELTLIVDLTYHDIEDIRILKIKQSEAYYNIEYNQKRLDEVNEHLSASYYKSCVRISLENIKKYESEINTIKQKILNA